jgi:gliding motility-associated-like protein
MANARIEWNTIPPQTGATAGHLSAGTYVVSVSNTGSCTVSASVLVSDPDPAQTPQSNQIQAFQDTTIAAGNPVALSGLVSDPGRVVSYQWAPGENLDCTSCLNTLASPFKTTTYILSATDTAGCVVSDGLTIKVLQGTVYIPNVFKPDSDNLNDRFTVFAARDVERIELLQIYDRWGSLVFENRDFPASNTSFGWDGLIKGEAAASGVFLYVAKVRFLNGAVELYKGDLTVLR